MLVVRELLFLVIASIVCGAVGWGLGEPHLVGDPPLPPDEWFTQKLDHFDPTNMNTWKQRYWTNATHWRTSRDGPVFLLIGGEGEASPKWLVTGAWLEYAEKYGALCFQLEHRFYGKSRPTKDMSVENLRYLSSEQALADLANFISDMKIKYKMGEGNKWIVFGGSYPGSLAAWARLKYPHLVHAAVSTSGPLLAKSDFKEYFEVVRESLKTYSKDCPAFLKQAIKQINAVLKRPVDMELFQKKFKLCNPIDNNNTWDVATLFENLSGFFADVVQYNKDNRFSKSPTSNITIDDVCDVMMNFSLGDPIDRLAELNSWMLHLSNETCREFKYQDMIQELQDEDWKSEASEGGRQWTYQTCTEFGFFQTSSSNIALFGSNIPLDYYIQQCSDIFGQNFNSTLLEEGIVRTNMIYGEMKLKVSRVVFVHGTIDPWHALGITTTLRRVAPAILIEGTAHCANMYPPSPKDPKQLKEARRRISQLIGKWLFDNEI